MAAQQFWAQAFYGLVFFVSAGFLWFFVVRPILEGWGIIRARDETVNPSEAAPPDDYVTIKRSRLVSFLAGINTNTDTYQAQETHPAAPNATERDHIIWLAGKKKVDGSWALSANAIYDLVRGNRNEVMGWIREVRAEATDEPQAEIVTPYAGRRTKAAYYPEEPELEYQAP